jgi:hypothetical protein
LAIIGFTEVSFGANTPSDILFDIPLIDDDDTGDPNGDWGTNFSLYAFSIRVLASLRNNVCVLKDS